MLKEWRGHHGASDPKPGLTIRGDAPQNLKIVLPAGVFEGLESQRESCAVEITISRTRQG